MRPPSPEWLPPHRCAEEAAQGANPRASQAEGPAHSACRTALCSSPSVFTRAWDQHRRNINGHLVKPVRSPCSVRDLVACPSPPCKRGLAAGPRPQGKPHRKIGDSFAQGTESAADRLPPLKLYEVPANPPGSGASPADKSHMFRCFQVFRHWHIGNLNLHLDGPFQNISDAHLDDV